MNLFKTTLLLSLLFVLTLSQTYKQSANLEQLQTKIISYQADLSKLQKQIDRLKKTLEEAETTTLKITTLNEAQANQRDALITINEYLSLPFSYSRCQCAKIDESQKQLMNKQIEKIRKQLMSLKSNVNLQERCDKMNFIRSELKRQLDYLVTIQQGLNSKCCRVVVKTNVNKNNKKIQNASGFTDISTHTYQTNLKAGKWIYGCLTKSEVRLRYFSHSVNSNISNCPANKPYFNNVTCVSCPEDNPIWDLCLAVCINCPGGYDKVERACIPPVVPPVKKEPDEQQVKKVSQKEQQKKPKIVTKWENVIVSPIEQQTQIVAPIVGSSTITIITKNHTRTVTPSVSSHFHYQM